MFHQSKRNPQQFTPLYQARQARGLSLREVCAKLSLKVAIVQLSAYERGLAKPRADRAIAIARFYGKPVDELFGSPLQPERKEVTPEPKESRPGLRYGKPIEMNLRSGSTVIQLNESLKRELTEAARYCGVTAEAFAIQCVEVALAERRLPRFLPQ